MLKKIVFATLVLILVACSASPAQPQMTVTLTLPPTNTALPTQTPQPTATPTITPIPAFSHDTWAGMDQTARDEALAKLSEISPDGYMRGGFSEVKDSLVKFYDGKLLVQVYDFKNGKYMTPEQAGIIEFNLVDNQKAEMLRFATGQDAIDYLAFVEGASMSTQEQAQYYKDYPDVLKEYKAKHGTNGSNYPPELNRQFISGFEVSFEQGKFGQSGFGVFLTSINGGSGIGTLDQDGNIIDVYVDQAANQVSRDLSSGNIFAPVN